MKNLVSLITIVMCMMCGTLSAQVMLNDSTIAVFPYFNKNDTMVYQKVHKVEQIHAADTTITEFIVEKFMIVCTKANDKKGYRLEQTALSGENLLESSKSEMSDKMTEAMINSMVGMKTAFTIDGKGENLAFENAQKTSKEIVRRMQSACDSIEATIPLLGAYIKEVIPGLMKSLLDNPTALMNNYDEMNQMFELHGGAYDYEKPKVVEIEATSVSTRPGNVQILALDRPDEGEPRQDWDNYMIVIDGTTYQDAVAAAIENVKQSTGKEVTAEQLALILGDEMPSGEIECDEYYENEYFGDGWPKELFYQKNTTQGEITKIELKTITWLRRSVGNQ